MPYRFSPDIEKELREFDGDDVGQVADEIRICKTLVRRAVEAGNSGLSNALLATIAKLSTTHIANQIRLKRLLESSAVVAIAQRLSAAISLRLANVPDRDEIVDALLADFAEIFRTERQSPQLTYEPAEDVSGGESTALPLNKLE